MNLRRSTARTASSRATDPASHGLLGQTALVYALLDEVDVDPRAITLTAPCPPTVNEPKQNTTRRMTTMNEPYLSEDDEMTRALDRKLGGG